MVCVVVLVCGLGNFCVVFGIIMVDNGIDLFDLFSLVWLRFNDMYCVRLGLCVGVS